MEDYVDAVGVFLRLILQPFCEYIIVSEAIFESWTY